MKNFKTTALTAVLLISFMVTIAQEETAGADRKMQQVMQHNYCI
jgi:hypothetical protein